MMTQLTVGAGRGRHLREGRSGAGEARAGPAHAGHARTSRSSARFIEGFTGGNLFVAEIYFVSIREFPGVKFGGPIGDVRDPETGLGIGTMVYGDFSVKVTEPEKLDPRPGRPAADEQRGVPRPGSRARCSRSCATGSPSCW